MDGKYTVDLSEVEILVDLQTGVMTMKVGETEIETESPDAPYAPQE